MSIKWLCVLTNGNIVKGKYLLGKNTSDWAIGWCNERKAYLFVCYLGRVSNDCRKLKSKKLVAICWELGGSGSSRWSKQTGSPVCHLSAYSSPALLGSFNPCHLTCPAWSQPSLRVVHLVPRRISVGVQLGFVMGKKKLMVASLAWLGLDEKRAWVPPGYDKCYLIRNCLPFHMLFLTCEPSHANPHMQILRHCLAKFIWNGLWSIQVFTTYERTNDSSC